MIGNFYVTFLLLNASIYVKLKIKIFSLENDQLIKRDQIMERKIT